MMMSCGVYQIKNTATGDYYIGSSRQLGRRIDQHRHMLSNNKHHNPHLQNAWNKHGEQAFEFTAILLCNIEHKLYYEQCLLDLFKPSYNIAICARANMQGLPVSEETRSKLSEAHKGKHHSEETRLKMSELNKGENNPNFGKHHTEEAKRKIGESEKGNTYHLGHKHTEETKRKISEGQIGRLASEEARAKLSEAAKRQWAERKTNAAQMQPRLEVVCPLV